MIQANILIIESNRQIVGHFSLLLGKGLRRLLIDKNK